MVNVLSVTELYTLKWLTFCYVNFISIKKKNSSEKAVSKWCLYHLVINVSPSPQKSAFPRGWLMRWVRKLQDRKCRDGRKGLGTATGLNLPSTMCNRVTLWRTA